MLLIRSTLLDTTGRPKSCCQARCLVCTGTQPSLVGCRCPRTLGQQGHWCAQQVRSACRRHGSWRWVQIHRPQPTCSQRMQLAAELGESRPAPAESLPQLHKGVVVHVCLLGFWPDLHAFRSLVSGNPSTLAACQDLLLVGCSRCINPFLWCSHGQCQGCPGCCDVAGPRSAAYLSSAAGAATPSFGVSAAGAKEAIRQMEREREEKRMREAGIDPSAPAVRVAAERESGGRDRGARREPRPVRWGPQGLPSWGIFGGWAHAPGSTTGDSGLLGSKGHWPAWCLSWPA